MLLQFKYNGDANHCPAWFAVLYAGFPPWHHPYHAQCLTVECRVGMSHNPNIGGNAIDSDDKLHYDLSFLIAPLCVGRIFKIAGEPLHHLNRTAWKLRQLAHHTEMLRIIAGNGRKRRNGKSRIIVGRHERQHAGGIA